MDVHAQLLTGNVEKSEFYSHVVCFFKCRCEFFHVTEKAKHKLTIPDKRAVDQVRKTLSSHARAAVWRLVSVRKAAGQGGLEVSSPGPRAPPTPGRKGKAALASLGQQQTLCAECGRNRTGDVCHLFQARSQNIHYTPSGEAPAQINIHLMNICGPTRCQVLVWTLGVNRA